MVNLVAIVVRRSGATSVKPPSEELFRFHTVLASELGATDDIALDLVETRTFGSPVIYERYGRASR